MWESVFVFLYRTRAMNWLTKCHNQLMSLGLLGALLPLKTNKEDGEGGSGRAWRKWGRYGV